MSLRCSFLITIIIFCASYLPVASLHLQETACSGSVAAGCCLAAYGRCSRALINGSTARVKTFISCWVLHMLDISVARVNSESILCATMAVWVITGASRGIGLELAQQLVARGDVVVGAARNPEASSALKELESSSSGKLHLVKMDVEDPETIKVPDKLTSASAS